MRARHLARSRAVSMTHVRGETLVVTTHGTAQRLDPAADDPEFRAFLRDHYGAETVDGFLDGAPYYAVDAEWLFAADMSVHVQGSGEAG